jgi:ElaB/YqjD/DUF883 family membrane-anchored ribosome-binding protein
MPLNGEKRNPYYREYMRRRRAKEWFRHAEIRWLARWERRARALSQSAANAQDQFAAIEGDVESRIKKNPWGAVAIAALIGLLIGKMS